jgi:hypothetical protein
MGIFSKPQPDAPEPGEEPSKHLSHLARARVSSAARLDAALVEVESSIQGLLEADRNFFDYARTSGSNDHGIGGHLRRVLRTLIVGQMQNATPQFIKLLGIPYQPARTRGPIANAVARTATFDIANLASESQPKEPAQ